MRLHGMLLTVMLTVVIFSLGCSQGTSPVDTGLNEPLGLVTGNGDNPHSLLGLWTFICNPDAGTIDVIPLREAEFHLNALPFLEPPPLLYITLESPPKISGGVLDVDIGIRNPFVGQNIYTGFDVCGIIFSHGSETGYSDPDIVMAGDGDTRMLNADGYTRWWNPAEFPHGNTIFNYKDGLLGKPASEADFNCTINGYKYFADGLGPNDPLSGLDPSKRGMFSAGKKNIRHYKIDLSGGLIFNYAIDACWKMPLGGPPYTPPDDFPEQANREEAWDVSITELENCLFYDESNNQNGGSLKLQVIVWDHFNANLNNIQGESLAGISLTEANSPIYIGENYSIYELVLTGENLTQNGEAELLLSIQSEASGYEGILPGESISAFFLHKFQIRDTCHGWVRTWGGPDLDEGQDVVVDGIGNIYVTGSFRYNVDFDPGDGIDEQVSVNGRDAFLSKFDLEGNLEWALTWGGQGFDEGEGLACDNLNNVYVAGRFNDTVDFDPGEAVKEYTATFGHGAFLSKFNPDGDFQWARAWSGSCLGRKVAVDKNANPYVVGQFIGSLDFNPSSDDDVHGSWGLNDIFISKYNSNGDYQWTRTWGGAGRDYGQDVTVDENEDVYVSGQSSSSIDFDPGPGIDIQGDNVSKNVFISKFNPGGNFQWARTWVSCDHSSHSYALTADGNSNIYVTGIFEGSVDFDPGYGIDEHTPDGSHGAFLSKFDIEGDFKWARTWDGLGKAVTVDNSNSIYVTGCFGSIIDLDPGEGVDEHVSNGGDDIFLSKFNLDGDFLWARTWGGDNYDIGNGVFGDGSSNIYVIGQFVGSVDFDPGAGIEEHVSNGYCDIYLSKFPPDGNW